MKYHQRELPQHLQVVQNIRSANKFWCHFFCSTKSAIKNWKIRLWLFTKKTCNSEIITSFDKQTLGKCCRQSNRPRKKKLPAFLMLTASLYQLNKIWKLFKKEILFVYKIRLFIRDYYSQLICGTNCFWFFRIKHFVENASLKQM